MTRVSFCSSVVVIALLLTAVARGQTQVLDVDALGGNFQFGAFRPVDEEYYYTVRVPGGNTTLFALSIVDGTSRQFRTTGVDVGTFDLLGRGERMLVPDRAAASLRQNYSVDRYGNSAPIPLNPVAGVGASARMAPSGDLVRLIVVGSATNSNPALRDRLYTRSMNGGPATEILGGIPQFRRVLSAEFSQDGGSLMVETGSTSSSATPENLFLATPGVTGLTQVLAYPASNVIYDIYGTDEEGDYFVVNRDFSGTLGDGILYSVPVTNPAAPVALTVLENETSIGHDGTLIDRALDRVLFTSSLIENNPPGQPRLTSLMSVPIDGSAFPASIGNLPAGRGAGTIYPFAGGAWDYVMSTDTIFTTDPGPLYAVQRATANVVEIGGAGGQGVGLREFLSNGVGVVFADQRTAGNDLYIGRPDQATPVDFLLDVAEGDKVVDILLSPDQTRAFVSLVSTAVTYIGVADRVLSVPLDGSSISTLIDLRSDPAGTLLVPGFTTGPFVTENTFVYVTGTPSGQTGFYLLDLSATETAGDYNADGVVDAADYTVWRDTLNQSGANLAADGDGDELVDADDYTVWKSNFGQSGLAGAVGQSASVPEPATVAMVLFALAMACGWRERVVGGFGS